MSDCWRDAHRTRGPEKVDVARKPTEGGWFEGANPSKLRTVAKDALAPYSPNMNCWSCRAVSMPCPLVSSEMAGSTTFMGGFAVSAIVLRCRYGAHLNEMLDEGVTSVRRSPSLSLATRMPATKRHEHQKRTVGAMASASFASVMIGIKWRQRCGHTRSKVSGPDERGARPGIHEPRSTRATKTPTFLILPEPMPPTHGISGAIDRACRFRAQRRHRVC